MEKEGIYLKRGHYFDFFPQISFVRDFEYGKISRILIAIKVDFFSFRHA